MTSFLDLSPEAVEANKQFLKKVLKVHEELLDLLDYTKVDALSEDTKALKEYLFSEAKSVIENLKVAEAGDDIENLCQAVYDEVMGFGPIEPLLRESSVTDIFVNAPNLTYVESRGRIQRTNIVFLDEDHIFRLAQRVASQSGRHLDLSTPYFDAQLKDGSRIHAIIPPCAIDGIKVSLRKYAFSKFDIWTLVEGGSMSDQMARFLQMAVQARLNIAICGGTGSGKTTLMNAMTASIGSHERIITIEDTPELEPSHEDTVRLLTRLPNPEGKGGVSQSDLMINALRMRPDRVILGEVRGQEAFNLLHAMNTGQDGSMVTLHASGAEEVVSRLLNMILMARYAISADSVKQQIGSALDLIIYVTRLFDGSRRVMTISQISNDAQGQILIEDIFRYRIDKITHEELLGEFEFLKTKATKRIENKMLVQGLDQDFKELMQA